MRPHLLITERKVKGLRSVEELRQSTRTGHGRVLWQELKRRADADLKREPIAVGPKATCVNWTLAHKTVQRVLRHALAFVLTGHPAYKHAALRQIEVTFDTAKWPKHWPSEGQPANLPAGLRVGQLLAGFGLAYDWLYRGLTPEERRRIVGGMHRQGLEPFLQTVKIGKWQVQVLDNFMPVIVGGAGIAAMALGDDYPGSRRILDLAKRRNIAYLSMWGPEGEWNESVAYSFSALYTVRFFSCLRYWSAVHEGDAGANIIGTRPLPQFCRWQMYLALPHGRYAHFGDCDRRPGGRIGLPYVPAVAAAARDPVLQWFYLNNLFTAEESRGRRNYVMELVWYDHTLKPASPEGRLPHGHAFAANTMCVSSRTDWNPVSTPCVVYGKGGAAYEVHGHHDVGQVCIDGHGERLIVDPGGYAVDNREYYLASSHNVLTFDGEDMREDRPKSRACFHQPEIRRTPALRAKLLASQFDDKRGGYWILDTSDVYDGVRKVQRTVMHLNPGVVVVLDEASLPKPRNIALRWHTVNPCQPDVEGRFLVQAGKGTHLASRVVSLGGGPLRLAGGRHKSIPVSYVEASLHAHECAILSLFCVFGPGQTPRAWTGSKGSWAIETAEGVVDVTVSDAILSVAYRDGRFGWRVTREQGR